MTMRVRGLVEMRNRGLVEMRVRGLVTMRWGGYKVVTMRWGGLTMRVSRVSDNNNVSFQQDSEQRGKTTESVYFYHRTNGSDC